MFDKMPIENYVPGSYEQRYQSQLEWQISLLEIDAQNYRKDGYEALAQATDRVILLKKEMRKQYEYRTDC